jgi:hypothetical protein
METKLTLKLNEKIINDAKRYAQSRKISLSKLIERYLEFLTKENETDDDISPLVLSLSGVIELPADDNGTEGYDDYLAKKYK